MVKETGEPLTIDGKEVTAEKTFTAEEEDGSIVLEFTFDSSALAGKHIVAFEDVEYKGISIGSHEDLEDEDRLFLIRLFIQLQPIRLLDQKPWHWEAA